MDTPNPPAGSRRPLVIAVAGKGGDAKSSSVAALGAALGAVRPLRVALVDLDSQGSLSRHLGPNLRSFPSVDDVLTGERAVADVVHEVRPGLVILPTQDGLERFEKKLEPGQLQAVIDGLDVDVVVLDTPASRPIASAASILLAAYGVADLVVYAFQSAPLSLHALQQSLAHLEAVVGVGRSRADVALLPTRHRATNASRAVLGMAAHLGPTLLDPIPEGVIVQEAHVRRKPLDEVGEGSKPAQAYEQAAREVWGMLDVIARREVTA